MYLTIGNNLDNLKEKLTLVINYKSLSKRKLFILKFSQYDKIYSDFMNNIFLY